MDRSFIEKNILSKIRMYFLNSKISKFLLFYNSKTKVIFIYIYININDIFQNYPKLKERLINVYSIFLGCGIVTTIIEEKNERKENNDEKRIFLFFLLSFF